MPEAHDRVMKATGAGSRLLQARASGTVLAASGNFVRAIARSRQVVMDDRVDEGERKTGSASADLGCSCGCKGKCRKHRVGKCRNGCWKR